MVGRIGKCVVKYIKLAPKIIVNSIWKHGKFQKFYLMRILCGGISANDGPLAFRNIEMETSKLSKNV